MFIRTFILTLFVLVITSFMNCAKENGPAGTNQPSASTGLTTGGITGGNTGSNTGGIPVGDPTLAVVSPSTAQTGAAFLITLTGTNIQNTAVAEFVNSGGTPVVMGTSTFVSATQLRVNATGSLPAGNYGVRIKHTDGKISNSLAITLTTSAPPTGVPTITTTTPMSVAANTAFTLTINGTNFVNPATLEASADGGVTVSTYPLTFNSSTRVSIQAPVGVASGTYYFRVKNPNGQVSNHTVLNVTP